MNQHGSWSPYSGAGSVILALVLLLITGVLIYLASRLHRPLQAKRPGWALGTLIVVMFVLSVFTFLVAVGAYGLALIQQQPHIVGPANPITPFTFTFAVISFFTILTLTQHSGMWVAFASALVGAIAAPMIFELPFDLIVMWRTFPPTPGTLFTLLFFLPLFIVELSSFAMLLLSPRMRLSRYTLLSLAGMFLIFAVWALFGFAYPSAPLPITLNVLSKLMAFVVAVSLFLPQRAPVAAEEPRVAEPSEQHGSRSSIAPDVK